MYLSVSKDCTVDSHTVISIPTALLWRVKLPLRKKLALASVLCVSVILMIISIVKVVQGQANVIWALFWVQVEAAVAVILVSITMFRSLFVPDSSRPRRERQQTPSTRFDSWKQRHENDLPALPLIALHRSKVSKPFDEGSEFVSYGSDETHIVPSHKGILVTHTIVNDHVRDAFLP